MSGYAVWYQHRMEWRILEHVTHFLMGRAAMVVGGGPVTNPACATHQFREDALVVESCPGRRTPNFNHAALMNVGHLQLDFELQLMSLCFNFFLSLSLLLKKNG